MKNSHTNYFTYFNSFVSFDRLILLISTVLYVFVLPCIIFESCSRQLFAQTGITSLPASSSGADAVYRDMLFAVEGAISISADVRQQIHMFGQDYKTFGTYDELKPTEKWGAGNEVVRFRLKMRVESPANIGDTADANPLNSLLIVCDKDNFIHRYLTLEGEKRLERIDANRVVEAIEKQGRKDIPTEAGSMFGLGGLAGMLRELRNRYDFNDEPITTQINEKNVNEKSKPIDVWKIHGRLKPEIIEMLTPEVAGKNKKLSIPKHTPTALDIYIGMGDRFPYRFDYYWTADGSETRSDPFAYLLFYNIELHKPNNIPDSIFDFRPPDNVPPEDITDQVINHILR